MTIELKQAPAGGPEQIEAHEATAQELISAWWAVIDREPCYPASTDTVVELLTAVQYDATRDRLAKYARDGIVPPVPRIGSQLSWNAQDIQHAQRALEGRRRWLPFSLMHGHKFTMAEKLQHMAIVAGESTFANDLDKFDLDGLLGLLVELSVDASSVQVLAEAIRQKLRKAGLVE